MLNTLNVLNTWRYMGLFDTIWRLTGVRPVKHVERRKRAKTQTISVKKRKKPKTKQKVEHVTLQQWKTELQNLQSHPLTQAKLINERLLNSIMDLLDQLNSKIDILAEKLDKLESRSSKSEKAPTKPRLSLNLSKKEEKILRLIKKKRKVIAKDIAKLLRVSRSNASLKLNKLYSLGVLDKKQRRNHVFYKIKR